MSRPVLYVLAGVNGAGKSSIGGHLLQRAGLSWYNPDAFARELMATLHCSQEEANALAWQKGVRRLEEAVRAGRHHAFETTLGGRSMPERILAATTSHEVMIWYCGLATPEQHLERVRARVARGGHDIPEALIHQRFQRSREHLIGLMPHLSRLQIHDNSQSAEPGQPIPDPVLLAQMENGRLTWPTELDTLQQTPDWARPLLEAAISVGGAEAPDREGRKT